LRVSFCIWNLCDLCFFTVSLSLNFDTTR
jgi:hypothetical protein